MEPGVSLYSRKVLIESKSPDIVPDWMRFVKGVVDSEDLPLPCPEKPQDTALLAKLRKVLTRKFISHLTQMARKEPERYQDEFYKEFGYFLKEGICQDYEFQGSLAKILYFETSKALRGDVMSFDEVHCTLYT
jgi:HSP90 family molecular chaperone